MTEKLYLVTVPVTFLMRSCEEHSVTNAYYTFDQMDEGADESLYFGSPKIVEVN
jgi:hypothetical protein